MPKSVGRIMVPIAVFAFVAQAKVLHIGNGGEPEALDPHRHNLQLEATILNDLFLGLTTVNAEGEIVPGVAQRWTVSEDRLTWTFELRTDARWSDGYPLTAHDFVFAFRRLLEPETAASLAHFLYPIQNAEAVNTGELPPDALGARAAADHTLVIELAQPFPFLTERLIHPTGYPVPAHVIEELGDDWVRPGAMVSNGAFVLEDWQPRGFVRLARNPLFHDAASVAIEGVAYHPTSDATEAYYRYRAGEFDAIGDFPAVEISWVREHIPDHLRLSPVLSIMYLVFNVAAPPFDDDVRVREALSIALDRRHLVDRVLRSDEIVSVSMVPPMVTGYASAISIVEDREKRLDRARHLLRDAGYGKGDPLAVTLRYMSGSQSKDINVAIAEMWREIDVATILHDAEPKVHFADLRQGNFQVAQAGWFGENNPEHYLDLLISDTGDVNYGRFASETYDTLMRRAHAEPLLVQRLDLLRDAEVVGLATFPVAPLYSVTIRALVNPRIGGWHENPRNVHGARYLSWNHELASGTPDPERERPP